MALLAGVLLAAGGPGCDLPDHGRPGERRAGDRPAAPARPATESPPLSTPAPPGPRGPGRGELEVRFLDVGQGDAVLVRTPAGKVVLVDGGVPAADADVRLRTLGVERIDLLLATHADYDHMGVHDRVLTGFPVGAYLTNGLPHTTAAYRRAMEAAADLAARGRVRVLKASSFRPGQDVGSGGVGLRVLPPPRGLGSDEQNLHSVGLLVTRGPFAALMTGDSEGPALRGWLGSPEVRSLVRDVEVYKAVHHGSADGDPAAPAWLEAVSPEVVVVQVGTGNDYGHPHREALSAYAAAGARVLRNDLHGEVTVTVDEQGRYSVHTARVSDPRRRETETPRADGPPPPATGLAREHAPTGGGACPPSHPVKGNRGSRGDVYHLPGTSAYTRTRAETCFTSARDATAAGFRAPRR